MYLYIFMHVVAVVILGYFILDIVTSLFGKLAEHHADKKHNRDHYINDTYHIEEDNTEPVDVKKEDEPMPEIPDSAAKKVSKEKKKME